MRVLVPSASSSAYNSRLKGFRSPIQTPASLTVKAETCLEYHADLPQNWQEELLGRKSAEAQEDVSEEQLEQLNLGQDSRFLREKSFLSAERQVEVEEEVQNFEVQNSEIPCCCSEERGHYC